jgi:hypothetical protein
VPTGGSAHHRRRGDGDRPRPRRSSRTIESELLVAAGQTRRTGHGATLVMSEAKQGSSGALQVTIVVDGEALGSRLPIHWHAVFQVMPQERRAP